MMEERETKLQAGKDALLAFQKKKDKKSKKRKTKTTQDSSITSSLTDVSIDDVSENNSLAEKMLGVDTASHQLADNDLHVWGNDKNMNGAANELQQVENELFSPAASVNEDQQQNSNQHANEITSLQMSLVAMETNLHNREKELAELKSGRSNEIDNLLLQQEKIRDEVLREQAIKFTTEINKMKEQMSVRELPQDEDEQEAIRIQQLKDALKRIHEEEIERIQLSHQQEKKLLAEENERKLRDLQSVCDQRIEDSKKQLEQIANDQIKEIHTQFMTSYNALMKEKCDGEEEQKLLQRDLSELQGRYDHIAEEKQKFEKKVIELEESHSLEIHAVRAASTDLELRLKEWKEKASKLQTRIEQNEEMLVEGNDDIVKNLQEKLHKKEEELATVLRERVAGEQKDEELRSKDETIQCLESQLQEEKKLYLKKLSEMEEKHQIELGEIDSQHSDNISRLEESISETSKSQASLEFAEVHMKELQQQLNAYRNQEMNHKMAMEEAKKNHEQEMNEIKEEMQRDITELTETHSIEAEQLKDRIKDLEGCVLSKEAEFQIKLSNIREEKEKELSDRVNEITGKLKIEYERKMEELSEQHQQAVEDIKLRHTEESSTLLKTSLQKLASQKDEELQDLRSQHEASLSELKKSLSSTGEQALEEAQSRVIDLELKSKVAEEKLKELRSLQEKVQKLETDLRSKEVNYSLSVSELKDEQNKHATTKQEFEELTRKYNATITVVTELKESLENEQREAKERFDEMLQQKEDEIATHQAHQASHQSRILELTDELAQEREISKSLKSEVTSLSEKMINETSSSTSELTQVQSQLHDAKERCDQLLKEWKDKEIEEGKLRDELNTTQQHISDQEQQYTQKIKELELRLVQSLDSLSTTTRQLQATSEQLEELKVERNELCKNIDTLNSQLQSVEEQMKLQSNKLQEDESQQKLLEDLQASNDAALEDLEEMERKFALMKEEKDGLLTRVSELESELSDKNEQIQRVHELELTLSAKESSFKKLETHYTRQLADAESRCQLLQKQLSKSQRVENQMNALLTTQTDLEKSLVKARQVLIDKLRQKELLEKDLNHHRTQLERRQAEKQRLEELLFEKSKFEQELRNQKEQLQVDLDGIERKLKAHNSNCTDPQESLNKLNWSNEDTDESDISRQIPT